MARKWLVALVVSIALGLASCGLAPTSIDFAPDRATGPAPLAVTFTLSGADSAQAVAWDFGDGGMSSEARPTHVYAQAGTYTVAVSVQAPGGPITIRKPDLIRVTSGGGVDSLFWIERGRGVIRRATLEGESVSTILVGLIGPEDLTVQGGRVYWTDPGAGTVESADIDGANRRVIAAGQNYPTGVAVDVARARSTGRRCRARRTHRPRSRVQSREPISTERPSRRWRVSRRRRRLPGRSASTPLRGSSTGWRMTGSEWGRAPVTRRATDGS
jgi:PKD repeat protein